MNLRHLFSAAAAIAIGTAATVASADTIDPTSFSADLAVGESVTIEKTVVVEATGPTDATLDVHFLIDTSGSMSSQINTAKAAATSLFNGLRATFGDVNASVGVFSEGAFVGTTPDNRNTIIGGGLTDNAATFQSNVDSVTLSVPDGGGDFPESGYTGIALAGDNLAWRPGSNRYMFVLTDASAKGDLAGAQATIAANDINVVTLSYGSLSTITSSYGAPLGGDVFASSTSVDAIVADVTAGVSAGFAEYETVSIGDLGLGLPEIAVSAVCTSADIGTCVGGTAEGMYDRSVDRTFTFDVTFERVAAGDKSFETYALVDGGIVAREADTFGGDAAPVVPLPAAGWMLIAGLGGLAAMRRRQKAA